jgi:hypothetical protein
MNAGHDVRERLREAQDLRLVLAAAREAFEWMLAVLEGHEDPAGHMFAAVMMAGAAAADGRDAIAFAPSCPPPTTRAPEGPAAPGVSPAAPGPGADDAGAAVADLCCLLEARLAAVASPGADLGDQVACADAARYAGKIRRLLTGRGP